MPGQRRLWHGGAVTADRPERPPLSRLRVAVLGAVAALLHGAFDAVLVRVPAAAPPYLRLQDGPDIFQTLSPLSVSIAASCVSGVIAAIAVVALEPARRNGPLLLGTVLAAFWVLSAVLTRAVWLTTPWPVAGVGIACGIPRGLVVGWCLDRLSGRRSGPAAAGPPGEHRLQS